jgi:phenylpropionate dioxygenase-like ring-hydroxylating dioxygenase large terminal subunit
MTPSIFYSNNYSFKNEIDSIFINSWLFFGFKSEFNEKIVINKSIVDYPIFLYKHEDNFIGYFNVCPHRGSKLVNEDNYTGSKKTILCPYHSWAFDLESGNSTNVKEDELINPTCTSLKKISVDVIGDFIFIKLSKKNQISLNKYLGKKISSELRIASELLDFTKISSKNILHSCNWKHIVENVIDNKHCAPVHRDTLSKLGFCKNKPITELFDLHSQFIIDPGFIENAQKRKRLLTKLYNDNDIVDYYKHILIFPNLTISIFEGVHYTIGYINPLDTNKSSYETKYLRPKIKDDNISNAIEQSHVQTAIDIFNEDVIMLNSLEDNLDKIGLRGELYKDEIRIEHFMKNYLNHLIN